MKVKAKRVKDGFLIPLIVGLEDREEIEVEIIEQTAKEESLSDEFVDKNWKTLALNTVSPEVEDDDRLYEATARYYDEKRSD